MILWTIKQLNGIRLAIAGRQHPSQLAWGVAFGLLLGVVPHGNLLAVLLLLLVLSLRLNHAIAGLTAVGVTFAAGHLDPWSDEIGRRMLTHPGSRRWAELAWEYPLVPWTDLNNTVVLGSLLIGLAMLVPTFCVCYPVFCRLSPSGRPRSRNTEPPEAVADGVSADASVAINAASARPDVRRVASTTGNAIRVDTLSVQPEAAITRGVSAEEGNDDVLAADSVSEESRMEGSLRFLLHQLRDSKPRDAA